MLVVECGEYLAEVRKKASELGLLKNLEDKLDYLATYACNSQEEYDPTHTRCLLFKDWSPLSFGFLMELKQKDGSYKRWFNGGCIFYGNGDVGFDAPQFSVRIGNDLKAGWSINT
jgi:hypothetical protein